MITIKKMNYAGGKELVRSGRINYTTKAFIETKHGKPTSLNEAERTFTVVVTKESVDRYGDVILVGGIITAGFEDDPVVLYRHGMEPSQPYPIGEVMGFNATKTQMTAKVRITAATYEAEVIWRLIKDGVIKAVSLGGDIIDYEPNVMWKGKEVRRLIKQVEWLELSIVDIPANRFAVIKDGAANFTNTRQLVYNKSNKKEDVAKMSDSKTNTVSFDEAAVKQLDSLNKSIEKFTAGVDDLNKYLAKQAEDKAAAEEASKKANEVDKSVEDADNIEIVGKAKTGEQVALIAPVGKQVTAATIKEFEEALDD